jgi:hypothetical protein
MLCSKCGKEIVDGSVFCPVCGAKQGEAVQQVSGQQVSGQQVSGQQVSGQQVSGQQVNTQQVNTQQAAVQTSGTSSVKPVSININIDKKQFTEEFSGFKAFWATKSDIINFVGIAFAVLQFIWIFLPAIGAKGDYDVTDEIDSSVMFVNVASVLSIVFPAVIIILLAIKRDTMALFAACLNMVFALTAIIEISYMVDILNAIYSIFKLGAGSVLYFIFSIVLVVMIPLGKQISKSIIKK